ncbi:hypothetical protein DFR70_103683 [Nocardia tenerifensis]|uniref:Uncharacterized protein n=2 Tax=Nocardia tenerifensis TaxID=228006 RepID=A0A318K8V1_9NOCA|nr:hypothetical protein DFR70_103683 [Nocardia tenerifensis]
MDHNDEQPVPTDAEIRAAASELRETIALKSGELADRLLARPEFGTEDWKRDRDQRDTPEGHRRLAHWHLTKLRIDRAADIDPVGNVLNARGFGASWQQIGAAYGISAEDAAARWERSATAYIERYSGTAIIPARETTTSATETETTEDRPRNRIERSR